jgi:O-antigen ligase
VPSSWAEGLLITLTAWGAFAFGGTYPWAYWPLAAAAVTVSVLSRLANAAHRSLDLRPLVVAFTLFAGAVAVQLLPLPSRWFASVSPAALELVNTFEMGAALRLARHPTSIAPHQTLVGLTLFVSFALLMVGSARLFTMRGPATTANAIAVIGAVLAIVGIIQKPLFGAEIYGFWTPQEGYMPFGPFVSSNHFAGWMVMALPLTIGLLLGRIVRAMRHVKPTVRDRLLWLSSPDASRLLLLAGAAAVMALSIALTLSRSGIAAGLFALVLLGVVAIFRQSGTGGRTLVLSAVVLVIFAIATWAGVDRIAKHFAEVDSDLNNRWGTWADAASIAASFPLVGTGLNTYGVASIYYQTHDLRHSYSAAHNDYLQLAAEGGVLLVVPALLCIAAFAAIVWKRFKRESSTSGYWLRVGAVTGLCAIALQETVDFSLQMPGNAVLFAVLCGIAMHASPERTSAGSAGQTGGTG